MMTRPKYSFWQVQDKVPPNVIQGFTKTCSRDDCRVSFRMGETTLAGASDWYDKDGNFHIEDRNRFTGSVCCSKCWRGATVDNRGNILDEVTPSVG